MSLIMQIVGQQGCEYLNGVLNGVYTNKTAEKQDLVAMYFRNLGLVEIGSGTNRLVFQIDPNYVFKVAIDNQGIIDNIKEKQLSPELEGYATRTYETNGIIAVAEYVRTLTYADMKANETIVRDILMIMAKRYLLDDVGFESYLNWGFRRDGSIVVLDYAYLHSNEGVSFRCVDCSSDLAYNNTFKFLVCPICGSEHKVSDMKKEALRETYGMPNILLPEFNFGFNQQFGTMPSDEGDNFDVSHFNV